ncbi:phosphoglycerol transferase [Clostridium polyendosporum]|uniref:Phosphoglycerol transferase n=1 Tax=Clostridium polyendosporum TaxID=69208 RepID=A0A919RYE1_9CLOT|nr:LTA synthase family protein [Clostridium polyendosporum]GIM28767.1 phosphoglycerol transferase [Clostridium polyendosporum]
MKEKSRECLNSCIYKYLTVIAAALVIMIKSMFFLAMLRTQNSSSLDFERMYFTPPPMWAHIAFVVLVVSFSFLFKRKGRNIYLILLNMVVSFLLLFDIWYFRANGTFLSFRHILYPDIFNPLGKNLFLVQPIDVVFFIDFIAIALIYIRQGKKKVSVKRQTFAFAFTFVFSVITIISSHYYIDIKNATNGEKMLFQVAWAPFQTMSNMSPLGYHGYDIYKAIYEKNAVKLDNKEVNNIKSWFESNKENLPDNKYKGMMEGKNVIFIQVESLENFVVGQKVYGQEITPNLNRLINNGLYFNSIHEQNNVGTSSDADLMVNTGILPIRDGSTFFNHPVTKYTSLPRLLGEKGYHSISTHPEVAGNWNWAEAHKGSLGFNEIWDIHQFNVDEQIGLGMSDGSYLRQIADKLKNQKQPFYAYMVTLTSHGPFDMPEKYKYLSLPEEFDKTILGAYFQSIRYTDEQIGAFIKKLDDQGQLKNSVIVIYGDHTGVHKFYPDRLKEVKLEGDWWQKDDKKVPFIIYNPELKGETIDKFGGQIDIMPTVAYIMGVDRSKFENSTMGRVLVNTERNATVLNYGQVVGLPKDEKEESLLNNALKVADEFIRGNYLKQVEK